jgi:hypothetical protein
VTDASPKINALGAAERLWAAWSRPHTRRARLCVAERLQIDDFRPFVYVTNDFGATWRSIAAGLPNQPVNDL